MEYPKVLSIQSHVVYGYVGNKSAVFPLQTLGFDVCPINTVQFCTSTAYKVVKGTKLAPEDLRTVFEGLEDNELLDFTHLLTGYIGNPDSLRVIADIVKKLKSINPNLTFVMDPVMGDYGRLYVPLESVPVYKEVLLPLADIICPNQTEAELLSGLTIKTEEDIKTVFEYFHSHGIPNVVITSSNINEKEGLMKTYASSKINDITKTFQVQFPSISASFIGTGDVFASLLLAYYHHENKNTNTDSSTDCALSRSIEKVIATMQAILQTTLEYSKVAKVTDSHPNAQLVKHDLKLIQSKKHIENPVVIHKAQPF